MFLNWIVKHLETFARNTAKQLISNKTHPAKYTVLIYQKLLEITWPGRASNEEALAMLC
jgi:hypothetical protein